MHLPVSLSAGRRRFFAQSTLSEVSQLIGLALPVTAGLLSGVMMTVIDTLMLVPLGVDAVAAVGLATSSFIIVSAAILGFASVFSVSLSQAIGSGDQKRVADAMGSGLVLTLLVGLLAGLLMVLFLPLLSRLAPDPEVGELFQDYWLVFAMAALPHAGLASCRGFYTAFGKPWLAVLFTLAGVAANIPLNLVLIHGLEGWPGLGVSGAAWASLLAKLLTLVLFAAHFSSAPTLGRYRQRFRSSRRRIGKDFAEGASAALGSVSDGGAYAATGMLIALMGTTALAAHQAVHSVGVLFFMVPIGMMIAVSIRAGQIFGAGQFALLRPLWFAATAVICLWSLVVVVFVLVARHPLSQALGATGTVSELAATLFLATAFLQAADGLQSTSLGALRGVSDNKIPNLVCVLTYWLVAMPLAVLLGFVAGIGPLGVLLGYGAGVLLTAGILMLRFFRKTKSSIRTANSAAATKHDNSDPHGV